ncbi:MAG: hypothetical protein CO099_10685 [Bdellovibrio sp. CG_4_9_14_3_um_filter_39_7]|nr:MAG: hypothetical protein CO099_10685 [Bdellovibrio sp. CG_4_9_14_3_um_filter_39_7]
MGVSMLELIIIGAGPAGLSMAAEAVLAGIPSEKIVILEKSEAHSWSIRKFYPDQKLVTANYKGKAALCKGVMCLSDSSKADTISYLDQAIESYKMNVKYLNSVHKIDRRTDGTFLVETDKGSYEGKICVIAIGMMGKPNKPDYAIPSEVRDLVTFDITTKPIRNSDVLVVGGGDSASEYAQYLNQEGNRVSFSYRKDEFSRMNEINQKSLTALFDRQEVTPILKSNITELRPYQNKVEVVFGEAEHGAKIFDVIVYALGGSTPKNFLSLLGIAFNGEEPVVKDGFETSIPGLFLIGDLSAGKKGGSIISAFNSAHEAMQKICQDYLECKL